MSAINQTPPPMAGNTPVERIRVSFVTVNIWRCPDDHGRSYVATVERCYQVNPDRPRPIHDYDGLLLLALVKAAKLAHARITELQAAQDA